MCDVWMWVFGAGARGEAEAPGSDQAALGGQPEAPGGISELRRQAEEVHRVGLQHHRPELRAAAPSSSSTRDQHELQ